MTIDHSEVAEAIERMNAAANGLPGAFSAEFALVCYGGVTEGAENWACEVEADVVGSPFAIWGHSPSEAINGGIREAWRRVVPGDDELVEIIPFSPTAEADTAFARWLWVLGMNGQDFPPEAFRIDDARQEQSEVRRYLVKRSAIPHYDSPPGLGTRAASYRPLLP